MAIINPIPGVQGQFNRALNKFKPPEPLPTPVTRSFLFEIINTQTSLIEKSFALVVPPQAVSIREPERVSITKTFGNVFVDDYGPDNIQIMIRGFSGTSHAWPTFRMGGSAELPANTVSYMAQNTPLTEGYTHKTAFYTFRDEIMRYKLNNPDTFGDMKLRVYDLYDEQSYDCVLMEFSCDRTSERPLYYPYTITLLAYRMPDAEGDTTPTPIMMGGVVDKILTGIDTAVNWMQGGFAFVSAIKSTVATIANTANLIASSLATFTGDIAAVATSPLDLTKQLFTLVDSFASTVETAYSNYKMTEDAYLNAKEMVQDMYRNTLRLYHEAIGQGAQSSRIERLIIDLGLDIPSGSDIHVLSTDRNMGVKEASRKYKVVSKSFSGVKLYSVKGKDTLQSIALSQMGDSNLWPYLASVNKLRDNTDLQTKTEIYVPDLSQRKALNKDSFIVTEDSTRDPYGTDIRVDSNGNFVLAENNDFALISGLDNVQQSVDRMFKTPLGSMLKQTAIGLSAQPGMPGTASAFGYLRMGCRSALKLDPRISKVSKFYFTIQSDVIEMGLDLEIVGSDKVLPVSITL